MRLPWGAALAAGALVLIVRVVARAAAAPGAVPPLKPLRAARRRGGNGGEPITAELPAVPRIETLEALYASELRTLMACEARLVGLLGGMPEGRHGELLEERLRERRLELPFRRERLKSLVNPREVARSAELAFAMPVLIQRVRRAANAELAPELREARVIAALRRVVHYRIAAYGSAALHAETLGQTEAGARLADYTDEENWFDEDLVALARGEV